MTEKPRTKYDCSRCSARQDGANVLGRCPDGERHHWLPVSGVYSPGFEDRRQKEERMTDEEVNRFMTGKWDTHEGPGLYRHRVEDLPDAPRLTADGRYAGLGEHFSTPGISTAIDVDVDTSDPLSDEVMMPELHKGLGLNPGNPKDALGDKKPPLHLIPGTALVEEAYVMGNGAWKYGPYNWRETPVRSTVYVGAVLRHIHSFMDGYDLDAAAEEPFEDKGEPPYPLVLHLAAARASLGILIDAISRGDVIDDRPPPAPTEQMILNPRKKWSE